MANQTTAKVAGFWITVYSIELQLHCLFLNSATRDD